MFRILKAPNRYFSKVLKDSNSTVLNKAGCKIECRSNPGIKVSKFAQTSKLRRNWRWIDDIKLEKLVNVHGENFQLISEHFSKVDSNELALRYYKRIKHWKIINISKKKYFESKLALLQKLSKHEMKWLNYANISLAKTKCNSEVKLPEFEMGDFIMNTSNALSYNQRKHYLPKSDYYVFSQQEPEPNLMEEQIARTNLKNACEFKLNTSQVCSEMELNNLISFNNDGKCPF